MLILHTADWHVGRSFRMFRPADAEKLARDRLSVVDTLLGLAEKYDVNAVLCAGDLFDSPDPGEEWWKELATKFSKRQKWTRPVLLLPGNHDPLTPESVYSNSHPFRRALPEWVQVVDRDDFEFKVSDNAVVYATPCRSRAGDKDLAMCLPQRATGDNRVRIGMVHGSTFDMEGSAVNFPICEGACAARGLDYLAIGDWHSFKVLPKGGLAPIVYPGAPEPTSFTEKDAGHVALVSFSRRGTHPKIRYPRVARWTWVEIKVRSLADLQKLEAEDAVEIERYNKETERVSLASVVLQLRLDTTFSLKEMPEVERILSLFRGNVAISPRVGVLVCKPEKPKIKIDSDQPPQQVPIAVMDAWQNLSDQAKTSPEAEQALIVLQRLLHEVP
jgi:DNA repair exonuclease SbcCD nuclease subunit